LAGAAKISRRGTSDNITVAVAETSPLVKINTNQHQVNEEALSQRDTASEAVVDWRSAPRLIEKLEIQSQAALTGAAAQLARWPRLRG
jgi:hypothetical protein